MIWSDPYFVNLNTDGHEIIGIAAMRSSLYVVCPMNDTVFEFSKSSPHSLVNTFRGKSDNLVLHGFLNPSLSLFSFLVLADWY